MNEQEQIELLLKQEALSFIAQNSSNLFSLSQEYIQAILFKSLYQYASIPELTLESSFEDIVKREQILTQRDRNFQLVAKAELAHYEKTQEVIASAEAFGLEILKKAGTVGVGYLLNLLLVALIV